MRLYFTIRLLLSKSRPTTVRFTVRNHVEIYRRGRVESSGDGEREWKETGPAQDCNTPLADHLGHPRGSHRIFDVPACTRKLLATVRASFRAFSMPPFSSRRRSRRRRAHRNPSGKMGGKNSFLVIARGIPRVHHARRSI